MDKNFEFAVNGWLNQYTADIKTKVENFLTENNVSPEEFAEVIGADDDEIYDILGGNGEVISIETLIKVFMVLGLAIEIHPIEETPLGDYGNINPQVMRHQRPRPNPFMHQGMPPMGDFTPNGVPPFMRPPMPRREATPSSPFASKSREELCNIIRDKIWDSEIDLESASKDALVRFLDEKDRRIKSLRNRPRTAIPQEEVEQDPNVVKFIKNMQNSIQTNPQFKAYMKNFLKNLNTEE